MGWMTGWPGFDFWQQQVSFLPTTASRLDLGPTQPPIQWVLGALSLEVKWPGREADHSHPSSAEIRMYGAVPYLHHISCAYVSSGYVFMAWYLVKHKVNFSVYLHLTMYQKFTDAMKASSSSNWNGFAEWNVQNRNFIAWLYSIFLQIIIRLKHGESHEIPSFVRPV